MISVKNGIDMEVSDLADNFLAPFNGILVLNRNIYIDQESQSAAEGIGEATMWTAIGFFGANIIIALST